MGLAQINIKFSADLRGFSTEMQNSIRKIGQLGNELQKTGKGLSLYLTLPLVAAGGAAIKFASDYQESLNKVDVAFGDSSTNVREFAKTSLESFGIAEGTALDMAATFGDMATALGLPVDKAANMSKSLVGLAGDLASFKNISTDIANTALSGIFTGETESLKKLGVVMTEANLQAFALSNGINKQVKDMSQAEKVTLRYNYILSVTKNAQGDFARTGGGAANQTRIFQESLKQVGQQLGSVILPAFTKLITFVNGVIKSFSGLSDETKTTVVVIAGIAAAIGPLLTGVGGLLTLVPNLITKFNALKTAFVGLQSIVLANPYTALAIAIAAIVGGLILWYSNTKQTVSAQQSLNEAIQNGNKAASSEIATLDRLYAASTNVKTGIKERKAAYESLQQLYPAYFKNIDFENLKNAQSIGIYKELREAIFNKSRAKAIENELQKRADERIEKELEIKNKIAATEAEILRIKKASTDTVIKGSAAEKTTDVVIRRSDQIVAQTKLLKIQRAELDNFTKNALSSDQILLDSKAEYDAKTSKLTENEIQRQKDIAGANALTVEGVDALKFGTIAYYESLISLAQKSQKEVALNSTAFELLQNKIDGYQKKIDAISQQGPIKLPKPELPTLGEFDLPELPSFSLQDLKGQKAYFEQIREQFSKTSQDYILLSENIENTKIKIKGIEGFDEINTQFEGFKVKVIEFKEQINSVIESAVEGFAGGVGEAIAAAFSGGDLLTGITTLLFSTLGNMLVQLGEIAIAAGIAIETIKKSLATFSGIGAIAIGITLVALGSIVKSQVAGAGKFANGGIVGGSSFYGDKILARVNSGELILNNKQQKNLLGMMGSNDAAAAIQIYGQSTIKGSDLEIVFTRWMNTKSRLG